MTMRTLTASEAVMLLPAVVDRERLIDALAWLGISRDVVSTLSSVRFEPDRIVFEVFIIEAPEPRTVTVEARVRP